MEDRKQKEIAYYDKQAEEWMREKFSQDWKTDFEGFSPNLLSSFQFCYKILGENCRFYPSCSEYTYQAIEKYGLIKGSWKGARRILRCYPWSRGGIDLP